MSPSLSVLVLSLVVGASPGDASLTRSPTNAERAKRGLLPRRSAPARVAYLDGAARHRGEVKEFPALAASHEALPLAAAPAPVAADGVDVAPAPERAVGTAAKRAAQRVPEASPAAAGIDDAAETSPAAGEGETEAEDGETDAPVAAAEVEDEVDAAPAPAEVHSQSRAVRPPDAVRAQEEAADRARDAASASEAMLVERAVDGAGRIVERRLGRNLEVLSVRVLGTVDALPVLASERLADGDIVERVQDRDGPIEVRRDPVGRFRSARALPALSDDD